MFKKLNFINQKGQLLVELILVMGLVALLLPALLTGFTAAREGKPQQQVRTQASALLKETEVALKAIKNNNWTTISGAYVGNDYYPSISGSSWTLTSGTETIGNLSRRVVLSSVQRNSAGAIVSSGGTVDPSTKQVTIYISWTQPSSTTITSTLYLTRTENITYTESSQAVFNSGTKTGTVVTNTNGGEIVLASGGGGDWCSPNLSITAFDLPKNGVANAITAIEGRVFAGTGDNASGVSFANVNITNTDPPAASNLGTFDGYKTNGVFGDANYAYLATDTNSKEIVIMNLNSISGGKYAEAGSFNAPGNGSGNSVFVTSTYGFMTTGSTLYNFNKVGSALSLDANGVALANTGNRVYVVGNYAYVATNGTSNQLQIVNISNPSNLSVVGSLTVAGQAGKDLYVNSTGTRAYLVTGSSSTQREFFIINVSNKSAPSVVGSYDTSGMSPKGVTVVTSNKAIAVGTGGTEYQVIDISNESSPIACGSGLNIDTGVNGVSSVVEADGDAYSYIITGDSSTELKIIEGGPGGQYATSGTFISAAFDPMAVDTGTNLRSFNRFVATVSEPVDTDLKMQVSIQEPISNSCSGVTYDFVGPGGTTNANDVYDVGSSQIIGVIPPGNVSTNYKNPGRCAKFKLFFDTDDVTQTPVFYDITWNYSP